MNKFLSYLLVLSSSLLIHIGLLAQVSIDLESGWVKTGYNNVKIPGNVGTFFSLSDELNSTSDLFIRFRGTYAIAHKSSISILIAPLTTTYNGLLNRNVYFQGSVFSHNSKLDATYKFNSYRLSYLYSPIKKDDFELGFGLTLKVRDAFIRFKSNSAEATKYDLGIVPLIGFRIRWSFYKSFGILVEGDALAAPQGRAEDILFSVTYQPSSKWLLYTGYRFLEGGAKNSTVYTFAYFHYYSIAIKYAIL
jgi:hypothetical protein